MTSPENQPPRGATQSNDAQLQERLAAPSGSGLVGFRQAEETSLARTVQGKLRELRSSADYPNAPVVGGWSTRCFGVGLNVLGGATFKGSENIAVGADVLTSTTTGYANVGIGVDVLPANTTGSLNYGLGVKCLLRNTSGSNNHAIGTYTLYNNTTGSSNVAIGQDGQRYADTGSYNVTVGVQALYNNGTGGQNTVVGTYAARGFNEPADTAPAIGPSPNQLCAFGYKAVYSAAGIYNHGFGVEALFNVTGNFNTAIGGQAGHAITSGANNVFVGHDAGGRNLGQSPTASGAVAVGQRARTTGDNATALGVGAISNLNGVAIGNLASASGASGIAVGSGASAVGSNAIAIGQNVLAPNHNQVVIGNSSNTGNFFYGGVLPQLDNAQPIGGPAARWAAIFVGTGVISTSDERVKAQIRAQSDAESRVARRIKGLIVAFKFDDAVSTKGDRARWHFGVGAQAVAAAFSAEGLDPSHYALFCFDEWPNTNSAPAGSRYGIRYDELAMFILAAI